MECSSAAVCERRDREICYLGWLLLFLWLIMVIYITKEIWSGSALSSARSCSRQFDSPPPAPRHVAKVNYLEKLEIAEDQATSSGC